MTEAIKPVLNRWVASLTRVIESMTDQRPEIRWAEMQSEPVPDPAFLWMEQAFRYPERARIWMGAPVTTWETAGTLALKAAGLDTMQAGEIRNTWIEMLVQSLAEVGRAVGVALGGDVSGDASVERAPDGNAGEWITVEIRLAGEALPPVCVLLSEELAANLASPRPEPAPISQVETRQETALPTPPNVKNSPTLDFLLDIELPVSISFGSAQLPLKEVVKLNSGSIVELDRLVGEPVEVLVNQRLIARGEVVVVEGNYGVRIQQIVSQAERLRSIQ